VPPRLFILDYGGVLATPQPAADIEALAEEIGLDVAGLTEAYWAHRQSFDLGLEPGPYWSAVAGRPLGADQVARLEELDQASWSHPDPAALALVKQLLDGGARFALLSNAPAGLAAAIDQLAWMEPVQRRFYSCRLGVAKPDPRAYRAVLEQLGADPGEAFFVDDRPDNVAGAERVGIPSMRFTSAQDVAARLAAG
jgi:putative hydrolase of the HAD superfamily